jgi:hypothetical protein
MVTWSCTGRDRGTPVADVYEQAENKFVPVESGL